MHNLSYRLRVAIAIACVVCGLIITIYPGFLALTICRIIGLIALLAGVLEIRDEDGNYSINMGNIGSLLLIIIGAILVLLPSLIIRSIALVGGLAIIGLCIKMLFNALEAQENGSEHWYISLALAISGILVGLLLIIGGRFMAGLVTRVVGLALLVAGVRLCLNTFANKE